MNSKQIQLFNFKMEYFKLLRQRLRYENMHTPEGSEAQRQKRIFMRDLNDVPKPKSYVLDEMKRIFINNSVSGDDEDRLFLQWFDEFNAKSNITAEEYLCAERPKGGLGCPSNREKRRKRRDQARASRLVRETKDSNYKWDIGSQSFKLTDANKTKLENELNEKELKKGNLEREFSDIKRVMSASGGGFFGSLFRRAPTDEDFRTAKQKVKTIENEIEILKTKSNEKKIQEKSIPFQPLRSSVREKQLDLNRGFYEKDDKMCGFDVVDLNKKKQKYEFEVY